MNDWENNILKSITGNDSLDTVSIETLQKLAAQYPYFGVAQYLYAKKLQQQKDAAFDEQVTKTALHFSNTAWLNYLFIKEDLRATEEKFLENTEVANATKLEPLNLSTLESKHEPDKKEKEFFVDLNEEQSQQVDNTNENQRENIITIAEHNIDRLGSKTHLGEVEIKDQNGENTEESISGNDEDLNEKIAEVLQKQVAEFQKPVEQEKPIITNEPYYTIDYFASQGIKLEDIKQAHDKFETKVKRFTDWLKQMKRINPQPTDLGTDEETEKIIENIAATSNETKEIVTEAMAEVLVKQGKTDKAIQLYIKLSFLKPDKSTYFAAKIEALKGI